MSIYTELTAEFNAGGLCAILSSGQAVVLHRLAMMSKDGNWILRETPGSLERYMVAAEPWAARWPEVEAEIAGLPLRQAHEVVAARARDLLPFEPPGAMP